jgi:hypothetical protein
MKWTSRGNAAIATVALLDGRNGNAVIVGARSNPKGAVIVAKGADSEIPETVSLSQCLDALIPTGLIDILCMQKRLHGEGGITSPAEF